MPFSKDYTLSESNTSNKINAIVQDDIGNIWLGTDIGLYTFNGQVFTKIEDSIYKAVTALATKQNRVVAGYPMAR